MLAMKDLRLSIGNLVAADATILAPATDANKLGLFMNSLTPNENMTLTDVTPATFDGYAPKLAGTGVQGVGLDPLTGDQIITIKEPAGGWRYQCTGLTDLPQTIYGYYLADNGLTTLYALELLPIPITLQEATQEINLGTVKLTVVAQPLT